MDAMASQIASLVIVYSTVYLGADQRKPQSFASLAFVRGIHRWPVNSPHKGPVTRKMFPFHDVIMGAIDLDIPILTYGMDCMPPQLDFFWHIAKYTPISFVKQKRLIEIYTPDFENIVNHVIHIFEIRSRKQYKCCFIKASYPLNAYYSLDQCIYHYTQECVN